MIGLTLLEMDLEFEKCEQVERQNHDDKVKELEEAKKTISEACENMQKGRKVIKELCDTNAAKDKQIAELKVEKDKLLDVISNYEVKMAELESQRTDLKEYCSEVSKFLHDNSNVRPEASAYKKRDILLIKELKLYEKLGENLYNAPSEYIETNLNNYVKVKLNEHGREIHRKFWEPYCGKNLPYKYPGVDSEGYSKFQIHDFMLTFGSECSIGSTPFCEENNILIQRKL